MAKAAAGGGGAASSVADQLRALGVKGVLVQMAERGQLLALKCEMPQCYHHKGRGAFDPVTTPRTKWAPSPDHYPILKSAGGHLVPENVRLSHIWCNNRDYGWRMQIRTLLAKGKSLVEIAEALNSKGVPPPTVQTDGRPPWCARPTCPRPAVGTAERPTFRCRSPSRHRWRQTPSVGFRADDGATPRRGTCCRRSPTHFAPGDSFVNGSPKGRGKDHSAPRSGEYALTPGRWG